MQQAMSAIALIVSICALLFGGLLGATWGRVVSAPEITASINNISHGLRKIADQPLLIPEKVVEESRQAQFFPTMESNMTSSELEEMISNELAASLPTTVSQLELLQSQLSIEDASVSQVWARVSTTSKSALFAFRTERKVKNKQRTLASNPKDIARIAERMMSNKGGDGEDQEDISSQPGVQEVLTEVLTEITRMEAQPERKELLVIVSEELPKIKAVAAEYARFTPVIKELIAKSKVSANNTPPYWDFAVTFYNNGGTPASLVPVAVVAVNRSAQKNATLYLIPENTMGNIVVEPGKAVSVTFRSVESHNPELSLQLVTDFKTGDRDFRLLFRTIDQDWVVTSQSNFSSGINEASRKEMLLKAEGLGI